MHKCATLRMHMHMCRLCTYSLGTRSVPAKSHVFRHLCNYTGMHIDRFDCSCESEITGVYIETHYFYILNEYGLPIELWQSTNNHNLNTTTYKLQWRRSDIHYIAQYNSPDHYPSPLTGGSISYEPHPLIGREPKHKIKSVI